MKAMEDNICFTLLFLVSAASLLHAQTQEGFISLDCGLPPEDSPYTEKVTNLNYTSDADFIKSGIGKRIKEQYRQSFKQQGWFLRSFPLGNRNCYDLNVNKGTKYLIRAGFVYGNYDDLNMLPNFDVHLGPNKWTSIEIGGPANESSPEIIHTATSSPLQICLVKTGETTPFITALELRPLANNTYNAQRGSLMVHSRRYLSSSNPLGFFRFSQDVLDRVWTRFFDSKWTDISTAVPLSSNNPYEVPQVAMNTAATPTNSSEPLTITWNDTSNSSVYYTYFHFAEIEMLKSNETREFTITINGAHLFGPFKPLSYVIYTIYSLTGMNSRDGQYKLSLVRTTSSTHPPILNAIEICKAIEFSERETDQTNVDALKSIKNIYGVERITWQGDPCAPKEHSWEGVDCTYPKSGPHKITSLNLSSSRLGGTITPDIQFLTDLKVLDLSNNNLVGGIPEFLAQMKSLLVINLSGNKLNGSVPKSLTDRKVDGLNLNVERNAGVCESDPCSSDKTSKKKNILVPVIASVASLVVVLAASSLFFILRKKMSKYMQDTEEKKDNKPDELPKKPIGARERRFAYKDIVKITNNFERVLGRGGFGKVYHGYVDDEQVAVKMLSQPSEIGSKQFSAEVHVLLTVHHKNLVKLVGYCDDAQSLALIYEYMANGDLHEHLWGKDGRHVLSWESRLKIALEAAEGLDYLHNGCTPPFIHRDVKTSNILLNEQFQAKMADLGLSKCFPDQEKTHLSTVVAGTPGYLDPEYAKTKKLTLKSDVYSFGVVLLAIVTNRRVNDHQHHISEWVKQTIAGGDIREIVDPKLGQDVDLNTVWKMVEVAMKCVDPSPRRRLDMSDVVMVLKQCYATEKQRMQGYSSSSIHP